MGGNDKVLDEAGAIRIRFMKTSDVSQVSMIENKVFPVPWSVNAFTSEVEENSCATYIVAVVEGLVVGYAGMWAFLDESHITTLAVHPDYEGQGIGSRLLQNMIILARDRQAQVMSLEVRASNNRAHNLYRRFGFLPLGVRPGYYGSGEDAIIMSKVIAEDTLSGGGGVGHVHSGNRDIMR